MAVKLTDTQTTGSTGVKNPATLGKWPEGGATAQVSVNTGTATVELRAWVNGVSTPEILATFVLPVPSGDKSGDLYDSLPVFSIWDDWDWNVIAVAGGATITLGLVGVGV